MATDLEQRQGTEDSESVTTAPVRDKQTTKTTSATGQILGMRLRSAREAKGLSVDQVAKQLCFTPQRVRNLEDNNYHGIPARAYARGYVQSYAKLLCLDLDEILRAFDAIDFPVEQKTRRPQLVIRREETGASKQVKWFGVGFAAVIVALLGFWWHSARDHSQVDTTTTSVSADIPLQQLPNQPNVSS